MIKKMCATLLVLAAVMVGGCSGELKIQTPTSLDGHGDKYLSYWIYRYDTEKDGKAVVGQIRWKAVMNPTESAECNASVSTIDKGRACDMAETQGSAATVEEAKKTILAHFESFKANNALIKAPAEAVAKQ